MGFSPGAVALLMTVSAFTWVTERTVAAVSQGRPRSGQIAPKVTIRSRSRWKPEPLAKCRSFLLTIKLQMGRNWNKEPQWHLNRIAFPSELRQNISRTICQLTHVVIWVSMNMRIKTSRAGITEAPIIQTGKGCLSPKGLINQLRLSGDVTEKPEGTFSFCNHKKHKRS